MRVYKHKTKEKYYFLQTEGYCMEYFLIEKGKNRLDYDFFSWQSDLIKFEKKIVKNGYKSFELPQEISSKSNDFLKTLEIDKPYYFIEKDEEDILKSNLVCIMLTKDDDSYVLHRISSDHEDREENKVFSTLQGYLNGTIATEKDDLFPKDVKSYVLYYFNLLFVFGFEEISKEELISYKLKEPILQDTVFEGDVYKVKNLDTYFKVGLNRPLLCVQLIKYVISNNFIVEKTISYSANGSKKYLKDVLQGFNDLERFEKPILENDFLEKYSNKIEKNIFVLPKKQTVFLPQLPLEIPNEIIEIEDFFDHIIESNKYYFFANTTEKDPMNWQVSFILLKNDKNQEYHYSKPFLLKDFNSEVRKPKEIEITYSSDRESFEKKQKKVFKKEGLKAISTGIIYETLTGKSFEELQVQALKETFIFEEREGKEEILVDVFDNYICLRQTSYKQLNWQFFKNKLELKKWIGNKQTSEAKLFKSDHNYISEYTHQYLKVNNPKTLILKQDYLNNPVLKKYFKSKYDRDKFIKSEVEYLRGIQSNEDYILDTDGASFSSSKTIIIEGDLIVKGTLYLKNNTENYILVKGDLIAENFIFSDSFQLLMVEGKMEVSNITTDFHRIVCDNASTNILLHDSEVAFDLKTVFNYNFEVSYFSKAIIEKEIFSKNTYGGYKWNVAKIVDMLAKNKPFLIEKIENTETDLDLYYQNKFENNMKDWGEFYPYYAGCEMVGVTEDKEVKGRSVLIEGGDWVVNDKRGKSGTYGVSHEDYSIGQVTLKKPKAYGIDYNEKPLELILDSVKLMERYQSISMLYMGWEHRKTASFFGGTETESMDDIYEKEKAFFVEDPYLALYWINHFGANFDKRYSEVVAIIEENNLVETLEYLKEPLGFFETTDEFYNMELHKDDPDLFLRRRSYLVYYSHSYKNYQPENLDLWWKSIVIYPKMEEKLIYRMRWLKNNLTKCNNWNDFESLIKIEDRNIPLLSYIFVCNPNETKSNKTKYANLLVSELWENKEYFKAPNTKKFGEILLWDIRDFVSEKETFLETANFYFQNNFTSKEYLDIKILLGINNDNIEIVKESLEKLTSIFKNYTKNEVTPEQKLSYYNKATQVFDDLEPKIIFEIIENINDHEIEKFGFIYLWNSDIPDRKKTIIKLFINLGLGTYDINENLFGEQFPKLIKNETDHNIEVVMSFLTIPVSEYGNEYSWEKSKQVAAKFFLESAHYPRIFNYLIDTIKQAPSVENKPIIDAIYTVLFSTEYDSKVNSTLRFSKEQIELMLDTICQWFLDFRYHDEGYRSIYYCTNPLAKDWMLSKSKDANWLNKFSGVPMMFEVLEDELKEAFESSLEFISDYEANTYLEYKSAKVHKFWKIDFYTTAYIITSGKIGTEGKTSEKHFENQTLCLEEGKKLIAEKLGKKFFKI